jgi:hypothetical protein
MSNSTVTTTSQFLHNFSWIFLAELETGYLTGTWHGVDLGPKYVGPCHHGMAGAQVANEGTTSNMKGSFEHNKKTVP